MRRSARAAGVILLSLAALGMLVGCEEVGGSEDSALGTLFVDSLARHPDVAKSFVRFSLATNISQLGLTPDQAGRLAVVARENGPELRQSIDDSYASIQVMADTLSSLADRIVTGASPEEAMQELMVDPDVGPMFGAMNGGPQGLLKGVLDDQTHLVADIVAEMDVMTMARVGGVLGPLRRAFGDSGELDTAMANGDVEQFQIEVDRFAVGAVAALGYDPNGDTWAMDLVREIIGAWANQAPEDRSTSLDEMLNRLLVEVRPVEDTMADSAARALLALVAVEGADELFEKAAGV